jgi:hypothetical protein
MNLPFIDTNVTINQLIAIFQEIAQNHAQINSFGYGQAYDINATTVENYPLLWVYVQPSKISNQSMKFVFRFHVMDLVRAEGISVQQDEVQSDTINTLWDIVFLLRDYYDLLPSFDINVTPFTEKFDDRVTGWYADIPIEVPQQYGICDVPFKSCVSGSTNYGGPYPYDPPNTCGTCVVFNNSVTVGWAGSGTTCDPAEAFVILSQYPGNSLQILSDGLYASGGTGGGGIEFVTTENTQTLHMSGLGTPGSPLQAAVVISIQPNNAIQQLSDGLYVSQALTIVSIADSDAIFLSGDGTPGNPIIGALGLSAMSGNTLSILGDGLYGEAGTPTPGGVDQNIQYNNAGVLAGASDVNWDGASLIVNNSYIGPVKVLMASSLGSEVYLNSNGAVIISDSGNDYIDLQPSGIITINTNLTILKFEDGYLKYTNQNFPGIMQYIWQGQGYLNLDNDALGVSPVFQTGLQLINNTAAADEDAQTSPLITLSSQGWSAQDAVSYPLNWFMWATSYEGANGQQQLPGSFLNFGYNSSGGTVPVQSVQIFNTLDQPALYDGQSLWYQIFPDGSLDVYSCLAAGSVRVGINTNDPANNYGSPYGMGYPGAPLDVFGSYNGYGYYAANGEPQYLGYYTQACLARFVAGITPSGPTRDAFITIGTQFGPGEGAYWNINNDGGGGLQFFYGPAAYALNNSVVVAISTDYSGNFFANSSISTNGFYAGGTGDAFIILADGNGNQSGIQMANSNPVILATPQPYILETDGTLLYFTDSTGTRHTITMV